MMSLKPAAFAALVAVILGDEAYAWTTSAPRARLVAARSSSSSSPVALRMAEDESIDKVQITSARKEVVFDDESGRFFETNRETEECIPEEEYCAIDDRSGKKIRLTVAEKERIFLDALQSYYVSGRQVLDDDQFDLLKEDLQWNGSSMAVLNRKEASYLAAMEAYLKGSPVMNDKEFDDLKKELKEDGSKFAVDSEPKCYIDTGICKATMEEDRFRSNLLYLPAGIILTILWLGFGYEFLSPIVPLNPLFLALIGSPLIYNGTKKLTDDILFENNLVAYGPCPSCEAENRIYFGNILGVEGFGDQADVKCPNCKEQFSVQRKTLRASTLPKA